LPDVADTDVIWAFLSRTTCESLVHKLGCKGPWTTKELLDIATIHAPGEEAVGAIFYHPRGKAKWDEDASEGTFNHSNKKKNKQRHGGSLVATAERKGGQAPTEGTPDHFKKLLKGSCLNHAFPLRHLYKDCALMKQFLSGGSKKGDQRRKPGPEADDDEEKDGGFPVTYGCLMIFDGTTTYDSKRHQKLMRREVCAVEPATLSFLRWSESPITFDRSDHPESIPQPCRYPLMVDPIVGTKRLTKVLMDGGSGLNIMYAETLDAMGINRLCIQPIRVPFHDVVSRKQP
jgi:hypothetical protein